MGAEPPVVELVRAIAAGDENTVAKTLEASPALARAAVDVGATREAASPYYLDEIDHYVYAGDTALHGAAYRGMHGGARRPDAQSGLLPLRCLPRRCRTIARP